jgi:hypothetical protein
LKTNGLSQKKLITVVKPASGDRQPSDTFGPHCMAVQLVAALRNSLQFEEISALKWLIFSNGGSFL